MSVSSDSLLHLTVDIVREIHQSAISSFGGSDGIRDEGLLESAVAAPQASFGGVYPYEDAVDIAAAYLFYLCSNHPFIDGNKRAALGACLVFLRVNGLSPISDSPEWYELTMGVASSTIDRQEATARLRRMLVDPS